VKETLLKWIKDLVKKYDIDGIRIDTVMLVPKWFWTEFSKAAGVYTVGEVCDERYHYLASYQGPLDAVLNYNMYFLLKRIWGEGQSMYFIRRE
jgi:alpha-amylase